MRAASFLGVALVLALAGCQPTKQAAASADATSSSDSKADTALKEMSPDDVEKRIAANDATFHVYDSNEKEVFDKNHVPGAKWVPFDEVTADMLPASKTDTLVFYCANAHWDACHYAAVAAQKLGFSNVYVMPAGIQGWKKAGKKIES
jgi:rhodanese-related sulfurtransferase